MKLIFCPKCEDVIKLQKQEIRFCKCEKSAGYYLNNLDAAICGEAIPIGFANQSFVEALKNRPEMGMGERFEAFVIPHKTPTINKVDPMERILTTIKCSRCGKSVSSPVPLDTVVRAFVECPDCVTKGD